MASVDLNKMWKTQQSQQKYKEMIETLDLPLPQKKYLIGLPLFEIEVQHMMKYITEHPKATWDELSHEVDRYTWEVTQSFGMTSMERDRLYPPI